MPQQNNPVYNNVKLRDEVIPKDLQAVHLLVSATGFFSEEEIAIAAELVQTRLEQGEDSGYYFIFAESGKQLVGYVCYGPIPGTQGSFDIYWIAVAPDQQKIGLGSRLIKTCVQRIHAVGGRRIYVETAGRDQYTSTRAFYRKLGYTQAACLPEFYGPGDAKIIYEKIVEKASPLN